MGLAVAVVVAGLLGRWWGLRHQGPGAVALMAASGAREEQKRRLLLALETYKRLNDHLRVSQKFVVPDSRDWPEDLWGLRLGLSLKHIRNRGDWADLRPQLEEMGFDFSPQAIGWG